MDWLDLTNNLGFPIVVVIYLLIDRQRLESRRIEEYDRLAKRLSGVEDYVKKELLELVRESNRIHQEAIDELKLCRGRRHDH